MPELNGLELQEQLAERGLILPIVFMTGYSDTPAVVRAIKAGAEDFLTKTAPSAQFIGAIERALTRSERIRKEQIEFESFRRLVASLTPREFQVFNLIIRGKINKQIAYELGTTERTVKAHRHQVMEKMKVHSLAELVSNAERFGKLQF
jgi:FixJ family two-component response regulator